jgi:DNA-binding response OmpR family regulator
LIVEDHPDLRLFIREHLAADYKIIEAENGKSGLKKAKETMPDLIISDIMMPEMDGYELCKRLKIDEKTNHIPLILLTAKAATEDKLEGLETGADDYLVKPFNPEELKVRVRNLIKLRQQMREKFSAEMLLKPGEVTEKLISIIEEQVNNEDFSVEMLGEKIGMSRVHLHRKIRAITNRSPSEFIRNFRLQRAAELIKQDAGNIAEIAYMVGFNSQAYFTRCFQEQFGCSPSEYKRREKVL